jgi:hypothetical protein
MKTTTILTVMSLTLSFAHAQNLKSNEIPEVVKVSFTTRFPKASNVSWSKENTTEFEAEFKNNGSKQSANFDQHGKWIGTEIEIRKSELPGSVVATLKKEFTGYKIEEAEKIETPTDGTFYEVEIEKGELNYEVQISAEGKVIKNQKKKEESKD